MIGIDEILSKIRKTSKTTYYQTIYGLDNKHLNIKIFNNDMNLTLFQINFLNCLAMYSAIYMDIYMHEVSDKVLDNEIYEDAYLYYKSKRKKDEKKIPQQKEAPKITSQWVFKQPKRG